MASSGKSKPALAGTRQETMEVIKTRQSQQYPWSTTHPQMSSAVLHASNRSKTPTRTGRKGCSAIAQSVLGIVHSTFPRFSQITLLS